MIMVCSGSNSGVSSKAAKNRALLSNGIVATLDSVCFTYALTRENVSTIFRRSAAPARLSARTKALTRPAVTVAAMAETAGRHRQVGLSAQPTREAG